VVSLWLLKRSDDIQMMKAFNLLRKHAPVLDYLVRPNQSKISE
jgi:hypothetical protein